MGRRTKAQVEALERVIYSILEANPGQSVRHVFYRLLGLPAEVFEGKPVLKLENHYDQVQTRMVRMREQGKLPYEWIVDASRQGYFVDTWANPQDFLEEVSGWYRRDVWARLDTRVEVWVESRSLAGTLRRLCHRKGVSLFPCGGFPSTSFVWESAQATAQDGKPVHIIYCGDYDPAGVTIDRNLVERLERMIWSSRHGSAWLQPVTVGFERVAVNKEQIDEFNLPTKLRKKGEKRAPELRRTVEAEALPAEVTIRLVEEAIDRWLPAWVVEQERRQEAAERDTLARLASLSA